MRYKPNNPENRMRARALLRKLLPEARKILEGKGSYEIKPESDVGENSIPHYKIDRCVGIHIYEGDKGGWFADLQFENLPAGIPTVFGTPMALPHRVREEALASAVKFLALVLANDRPAPSAAEADAIFPFDEVVVHLPSRFFGKLRDLMPYKPTHEEALARLNAFRDEVCGGQPLTHEAAEALPRPLRERLLSVCAMASLAGIVRFPEFEEAPPKPRGPLH
jgi:hypothetical protein